MTQQALPHTLTEAACAVLSAAPPAEKIAFTHRFAEAWRLGEITRIGKQMPPDRPARPETPELLTPGRMPRRKLGTEAGRVAFIHAIAHIELNAVDLAWDVVARYTDVGMPKAFFDDWVGTADDEARHFGMLQARLQELDSHYGAHPAHDGLWQAAETTSDDLLARLALVPMVLEARGLDTAPDAVRRFIDVGDQETAEIMRRIGDEEVPHVAAGVRWFEHLCDVRNLKPVVAFHDIVRTRFGAKLKPPFNEEARRTAGMEPAYYLPLAA